MQKWRRLATEADSHSPGPKEVLSQAGSATGEGRKDSALVVTLTEMAKALIEIDRDSHP